MSTDPHLQLAGKIEEAIEQVVRAIALRDAANIQNFGDLTLILAELRGLKQRAEMTRFR